jgi:hypothetical protein
LNQPADVDTTVQRIEALLEEQPEASELVQLLMQLYGSGLGRVMDVLRVHGSPDLVDRLCADKLVSSLLLLHGLHPLDVETRLRQAIRKVERRLESEHLLLEELTDGVAHIRVEHNGGGSPPSSLSEALERAVSELAPDLAGLKIEGAPSATALVQIAPAKGG